MTPTSSHPTVRAVVALPDAARALLIGLQSDGADVSRARSTLLCSTDGGVTWDVVVTRRAP